MDRPPIYIYSPNFTPFGGGPQALHYLCHWLNIIGYEAYVNCTQLSGYLYTPPLDNDIIQKHLIDGKDPISIYPEVILGNPFNTRRIVRYLLNSPGQRGPKDGIEQFWGSKDRDREYIITFSSEFHFNNGQYPELLMPILNESIFHENQEEEVRTGYLVYQHRQIVEDGMIPKWLDSYQLISMQNPLQPSELAKLYRKSAGLILFERTGAMHEALFCGCPVLIVPSPSINFIPMSNYFGNIGIGFGLTPDELEWSKLTIPVFKKIYNAYQDATPVRLDKLMTNAISFFDNVDSRM
jgi:O-antigen biosynthesis protein